MKFTEKQRLDYILEGTNVGTWEWNVQTGETVFDDRWAEIIGYRLEELGPVSINTWAEFAHPGDMERSNELLKKCFKREANYYHCEARMKHKNGEWVWVLDRGKVATWTADGQPEWMFGTHQEITAQKRHEEALIRERQLFVSGPAVVFKWRNSEGWPVDYVSPNVEQLLGYKPELIINDSLKYSMIIHPDDAVRIADEVQRYTEEGHSSFEQEYRMIRADGSVINVYDFTVCVRNRHGNVTHYDGYVLDITDRIRAEREIHRMQKLDSLGMVAGGIAHDFNNLLTGVFGNIQMAQLHQPNNSASNGFLKNALDAIQSARKLTGQLLIFAKGGAPVLESVNLQALIKETVAFNIQGSNVIAQFNLQTDLWDIRADKGQIGQVLANLTLNARQAMPAGGVVQIDAVNITQDTIATTTPTCETATRLVKINIRDDGEGIDPAILEHVFDPYFTTKASGHGLGLAVGHSIVTRHNGTIDVESTPGQGTLFTIMLPALPESSFRKDKDSLPDMKPDDNPDALKILLLDDEMRIRELAVEMLKMLGHSTETAADGLEAIDKYEAASNAGNPFDLVIIDLTIPGGTGGKETIGQLLKINPAARAIVASGYSDHPVLADYTKYGFSGKLAKPFTLDDLKIEIGRQFLK